jgi:cytochrome c
MARTKMMCIKLIFSLAVGMTMLHSLASANEVGSVSEANALLKKALAHIKKVGKDQAFKDFTDKKPDFVDRDLYVAVTDDTGKNMAHGANSKLVGKDLMELQDADGKYFINQMVELARTQEKFSIDYKFTDPITKKILPKTMFCEKVEGVIACVGVYKR